MDARDAEPEAAVEAPIAGGSGVSEEDERVDPYTINMMRLSGDTVATKQILPDSDETVGSFVIETVQDCERKVSA